VQQFVHAQGVLGLNEPQKKLDHPEALQVSHLSLLKVRLSKLALLLGDALAFALAFGLSMWLTLSLLDQPLKLWLEGQNSERFVAWGVVALMGLTLLLTSYQHYSDRRPFWDELSDFLKLFACLSLVDLSLIAMVRWEASRLWWLLSWPLALVMVVFLRSLTRKALQVFNLWVRPTIIIGVGPNASDAARALLSQPELGLAVVGFVDAGPNPGSPTTDTVPRFPSQQMPQVALQPGIQWVIALEHSQSDLREYWLRQLAQWGATDISVIPAMRGVPLHGTDMSHFFSHEVALLRMRNNLRRWPARLTKRIFDTFVAVALLLLLSPFLVGLAFLIRRDGGPAIFAHPRVGQNGQVFNCYKFRSMVVDAERQLENLLQSHPAFSAQWQSERKLKNDPRVSNIGRFLRHTSLDELPQLLNVILGQMSLVGPRPVVQSELERYGQDASYYLMVRPGMTGLWQVSGRNDVEYDNRVYLDTWYVKNWSIWYDIVILAKTFRVVMGQQGAY